MQTPDCRAQLVQQLLESPQIIKFNVLQRFLSAVCVEELFVGN